MSTRCQVQVEGRYYESNKDNEEAFMLYHHCDGYPSNIIPLIVKAFEAGQELTPSGCELCCPAKVASLLCHVDPMQFEPLNHFDLHYDIAYFYKVIVGRNDKDEVEWKIMVYRSTVQMPLTEAMTLPEAVKWAKTQK